VIPIAITSSQAARKADDQVYLNETRYDIVTQIQFLFFSAADGSRQFDAITKYAVLHHRTRGY
jgi:hypothetical protein